MGNISNMNERFTESAFTRQAGIFDDLYTGDTIINYKRKRVRDHVLQYAEPGTDILEINSGTGEDAVFFSKNGFKVHATDISTGMQDELVKKVAAFGLQDQITNERCSFTQLDQLKNKRPFGLIFSNFAGLNCTDELGSVLRSFAPLLKPKGIVTLVILPKFCLWEILLLFKGKFRTAFRRFFSNKGRIAHLEGVYFKCWYYNPSFIKKHLEADFEVLSIEGLCTLVPPSYMEHFAEKHPAIYRFLIRMEAKLKDKWPWRIIGDYYIITLKKKR